MLQLKILSSAGCIYEGKVMHATFPGESGSFAVYPKHAPIISTLIKGNISCFPSGGDKRIIPVQSGFVEVNADQVTACIE